MTKDNISLFIMTLSVSVAVAFGWSQREEYWLTAERGWGYALGIIGGSMMLILLLYPVRKHWKVTRNWFPVYHWFRMHMLLGIWGPVLILFHSNFHLGSLNSQIALFSMLLVASSGLFGRYAYQKIHKGLYGRQVKFSELKAGFDETKSHFTESALFDARLKGTIDLFEQKLISRRISLSDAFIGTFRMKKIQQVIKGRTVAHSENSSSNIIEFKQQSANLIEGLKQLRKMASFSIYTKLFSMWHIFHLPVFFMMIIAAIVHVVVVHLY